MLLYYWLIWHKSVPFVHENFHISFCKHRVAGDSFPEKYLCFMILSAEEK